MKTAPHMEYRWGIRAHKADGTGTALYPARNIKREARTDALEMLRVHAEYDSVTVVDLYDELPDDKTFTRPQNVPPRSAAG